MFTGTHFLVLDELQSVARVVAQHGGTATTMPRSDARGALAEIAPHHILSPSSNFPDYPAALDQMVPVTTPQWLLDSAAAGQRRNYRLYPPSPAPFLHNVVLCIADDLAAQDRNYMYLAARAFGGQYLDALSRHTTHLVALDLSNHKSIVASNIKGTKVKIVLPHWVDECTRQQRHVDETPYLLSNPQVLKLGEPVEIIDDPEKSDILRGKTLAFGADLGLSERVVAALESLVANNGGTISPDPDIVISKYKLEGPQQTLEWLFYVCLHQRWPRPNLLHVPPPKAEVPQLRNVKISVSGYSGDARHYISRLIAGLGAIFTKTLDLQNNYLICAKELGEKYTAAKERWSVRIVNHLWIEDCYREWTYQNPGLKRYRVPATVPLGAALNTDADPSPALCPSPAPQNTPSLQSIPSLPPDKSLGKTAPETLQNAGRARNGQHTHAVVEPGQGPVLCSGGEGGASVEAARRGESPSRQLAGRAQASESLAPAGDARGEAASPPGAAVDVGPVAAVSEADAPRGGGGGQGSQAGALEAGEEGPEVVGVERPRRSAREKAEKRLQLDMEDLNEYTLMLKSARKMKTFMAALELRRPDAAAPNKKPKLVKMVAILTGCEPDLVLGRADIVKLGRQGIVVASEYSAGKGIDTIVAPRILRTEKFLKSLSGAKRVLHPLYLAAVLKGSDADPADFSLDKVLSRRELERDLGGPFANLFKARGTVFQSLRMHLSPNLNGGPALIASILKAHGAKETRAGPLAGLEAPSAIVVAHKSDPPVAHAAQVVDWDWCVRCIFQLRLCTE